MAQSLVVGFDSGFYLQIYKSIVKGFTREEMHLIRCTEKLRKEMGLKKQHFLEREFVESGLGSWHANLLFIERKKCVLFANDKTLLNFLVPQVRRSDIRELHSLFVLSLPHVLAREGIVDSQRMDIASEYGAVGYAKSNNRSVLGSMNDMAYHYKFHIELEGGLSCADIPQIISAANHMPLSALKYSYPAESLRAYLNA